MVEISGHMKSLCEDIATGHADRKRNLNDLKEQAEIIRDNARKFLSNCRKLHKEMGKDLRKNLTEDKGKLVKNVASLRENFRKKEKAIRADLVKAGEIWNKMSEALRSKKSKPK